MIGDEERVFVGIVVQLKAANEEINFLSLVACQQNPPIFDIDVFCRRL